MMVAQGLQIASAEDSLAGLGVIAYGIFIIDFVLCTEISGCRCVPVGIQEFADLFVLHGQLLPRFRLTSLSLELYVAQDSVDYDFDPKDAHGGDDGFRQEDCERVEVRCASQADPCADDSGKDCDCGCNQKACSFVVSVAGIVLLQDGRGGAIPEHKPQEKHECPEDGTGHLKELEVLH